MYWKPHICLLWGGNFTVLHYIFVIIPFLKKAMPLHWVVEFIVDPKNVRNVFHHVLPQIFLCLVYLAQMQQWIATPALPNHHLSTTFHLCQQNRLWLQIQIAVLMPWQEHSKDAGDQFYSYNIGKEIFASVGPELLVSVWNQVEKLHVLHVPLKLCLWFYSVAIRLTA